MLFPFNFAPTGFAFCQGQLLPISQNTALFSLLGTQYGGNGISNFALPDLRGRAALAFGQGPGLGDYFQGESAGSEFVTLDATQIPQHTHPVTSSLNATARCKNGPGNQKSPVGNVPAIEAAGVTATYSDAAPDANMRPGSIAVSGASASAGGSQQHDNRQPYLGMNYCIALQGVFPSRQ
jgi:microcystin-dependent protein